MAEHHHHVSGRNLLITIVLNIIITLAQIVGGVVSGSLALLSDAMHNFSDVLSLAVAWGANRLAGRPSSTACTFGFKRAEILATLFNASALVGIALLLVIEAIDKFVHPSSVDAIWVIGLGALSILLNSVSVWLVKEDAHGNMNIKAAYLHLLSDAMTSAAVVAGGILMYFFGLFWIDPLVSVLIALYLARASYGLIRESIGVLMQFAPASIDLCELERAVTAHADIANIHHIHLWRLNDRRIHLEAHLDFKEDLPLSRTTAIVEELETLLDARFGIGHTTFQCEYDRNDNKAVVL